MRILTCVSILLTSVATIVSGADNVTNRPVSLDECIEMALKNNLGLRIARYNPQIARFTLAGARAGYEPVLSLSGQHDHDESGSRLLSGGFAIPGSETDSDSFSGSLGGLTPWGMTYGLSGNANDQYGKSFGLDSNTNVVSTPFSSSQSSVALDVTQPLLKNFWIDGTRLSISVAKIGVKQSDLGLKSQIMSLITQVETAYYGLEFQIENVKVNQKALELAQRLLAENKKRVEVGALAPLDEKQAEAEVAARQADLIAAQNTLRNAENLFRNIFNDDFIAARTKALELTPSPAAERQLFNVQDSWARAFENRPDYLSAKLDLEKQGVQLKFDQNQIYPQLDVVATYGYNGSGREFSDSLDQTKSRDLPFYAYGGRLVVPLGNGAARNRHKSSKAVYEQLLLGLKSLEQGIFVEVENDINAAQANFERIEATRKAREYAEAALAAEQKKLENGKSTSFFVLSMQRDLTQALSNEITAIAQYKISLAQFAQAEGTTLERRKIDLTVK